MSMFAIASAATFAALGLAFTVALGSRRSRGETRNLERRLRFYSIGRSGKRQRTKGVLASSPMARKAVEAVEHMPHSRKREEETQAMLERAGWPLRAAELATLRIAASAGGAIAGAVLLRHVALGAGLAVAGFAIPKLLLTRSVSKRRNAFMTQLPDTLQLLAGSLKAGWGLVQALDTLVKETQPPTSTEFSRVLSETRLGMPLEESLQQMADRIGSEDFAWVVMAIAIQRQVGGNLAELLTTVADTLRDREAVRRQVKVLAAEGKLSAYVLIVLPFAIAGYVALVNPSFLKILTGETVGRYLIAGAITLMGLGAAWMRKIIRIEV